METAAKAQDEEDESEQKRSEHVNYDEIRAPSPEEKERAQVALNNTYRRPKLPRVVPSTEPGPVVIPDFMKDEVVS